MSKPVGIVLTFVVGTLVLAGLPMVGWGLGDAAGFVGNPARSGFLFAVMVLNIVASVRIPAFGVTRAAPQKRVERQQWAITLLQILTIGTALFAPWSDRRAVAVFDEMQTVRYAGLACYVLGFSIMHLSQAALGRQFSVEVAIQTDHRLVTDGLYRYLRHPRYLGIVFFMTGLSLLFRSWGALAATAATGVVLLWRIHDEEILLRAQFGDAWDSYARRSWRLIPFVY